LYALWRGSPFQAAKLRKMAKEKRNNALFRHFTKTIIDDGVGE